MKIIHHPGGHISQSILIAVFQAPNFIALYGQVVPVVDAVLVQVFQPGILLALFRCKCFVQEGTPVFYRLHADGSGHPVLMPPDIKLRMLLPVGPRQVEGTFFVRCHGNRVWSKGVGRPKGEL